MFLRVGLASSLGIGAMISSWSGLNLVRDFLPAAQQEPNVKEESWVRDFLEENLIKSAAGSVILRR